MSDHQDFLVEIGTEELPPKSLNKLRGAFAHNLLELLDKNHLGVAANQVREFSSPRRMALLISRMPIRQPDREENRLGPAAAAAFNSEGEPTQAALGFARSCNVDISELQTAETDKGPRLCYARKIPGQAAADLLIDLVTQALGQLPIPKPMRWGDHDFAFVRPVHWVLMKLGEDTLSGEIMGCQVGGFSRGHRFHHPEPLEIANPDDYEPKLRRAYVIPDYEERVSVIRKQTEVCARKAGGQAVINESVLEEVANLVEWPVSVTGSFDQEFLDVPAEALISSMETHQKFFPVVDQDQNLLPYFVGFANIASSNQESVRKGLERVIRPRLADARFFWDRDLKTPLQGHQPKLERMVYQKKLGSLWDKTQRVQQLATFLAEAIGADSRETARAAELAKCDLLTEMVGEFPELQGIMGQYYARHQEEPAAVATAIEEQYLPRFAGDRLPATPAGQALALAERLDTLCGIFSAGLKPSGNRDPFGLRRAALGLIRIMVENRLDLDLSACLGAAFERISSKVPDAGQFLAPVQEFIMERLRAYYQDQDITNDVFEAVWSVKPTRLVDFDQRIAACNAFRSSSAAASLAAANKRIGNILKKAEDSWTQPQKELFSESAEKALYEALLEAQKDTKPLISNGKYQETLSRLAELRPQVDRFFDDVMVMAEDADTRRNRLALLAELKSCFDDVADVSQLTVTA